MAIEIAERYKLALTQHNHVSDLRVKIVQGWWLSYAAFAAAFGWVHAEARLVSWVVTLAAAAVTALMWVADRRNRDGFRDWRDIGRSIETDPAAGIPPEQRYFARLSNQTSLHSLAIDIGAGAIIVFLLAATVYLICKRGMLPS
jgi:hypothetical protein